MGRLEFLHFVHDIFESRADIKFRTQSVVTDKVYGRAECVVRREYAKGLGGNFEVAHTVYHIKTDVICR